MLPFHFYLFFLRLMPEETKLYFLKQYRKYTSKNKSTLIFWNIIFKTVDNLRLHVRVNSHGQTILGSSVPIVELCCLGSRRSSFITGQACDLEYSFKSHYSCDRINWRQKSPQIIKDTRNHQKEDRIEHINGKIKFLLHSFSCRWDLS